MIVGLDYMHARYFGSAIARFASVDPSVSAKMAIKHPQLWNRYSYAGENPLKFTDPTGREIFMIGTTEEKSRTFSLLKFMLHNSDAATYLKMDNFGRLTISGMSVTEWGRKFGGEAARLSAIMGSPYKLGVGTISADVLGDGRFVPISARYRIIAVDERKFPQDMHGTMQWLDTTRAHELFGHGARAAGLLMGDVGHINNPLLNGIGENEADGMWAENQYRGMVGLSLRTHYGDTPDDYSPPRP